MQVQAQNEVQVPLTLVMPVDLEQLQKLKDTLNFLAADPDQAAKLDRALDTVGTVHNTRFVILEDKAGEWAKLIVIALYDGSVGDYINAFARELNDQFNLLFQFVADAPTTPVNENVDEFIKYVTDRDVLPANGNSYRAYPGLTALDIFEATRPSNDGAPTP